ncbi:MAG: hypothetical protein EOO91_08145 [Pedobacter sp.]|nr:MAG: hypothetical protein EOO91_08145 [Pedobacter sp.]
MKKIIIIILCCVLTNSLTAQNKVSVADVGGPGCLAAYNNSYNQFEYQFKSDILGCIGGLVGT